MTKANNRRENQNSQNARCGTLIVVGNKGKQNRSEDAVCLRQPQSVSSFMTGPLDLSFWSFLTFLHHSIEKEKGHLL